MYHRKMNWPTKFSREQRNERDIPREQSNERDISRIVIQLHYSECVIGSETALLHFNVKRA